MSRKEQEVVEVLKQVDIPRNEAKFLYYLLNKGKVFSREIEMGANLRQPEVSNAAKLLASKKLIKFAAVKKGSGKGRPLFKYSLAKSKEDIVKTIDGWFMDRVHMLESDMERFNKLFGVEENEKEEGK